MKAITVSRCSAKDETDLLICGRSKGHEGWHETPIIGSDQVYTWAPGEKAISPEPNAEAAEVIISRR